MIQALAEKFSDVALYTSILPAIFYLLRFKQLKTDKLLQVIFFIVLLIFSSEIFAAYLGMHGHPNHYVYNFIDLIQTLLLVFLVFKPLLQHKSSSKIVLLIGIGFSLLWLLLKFQTRFSEYDKVSAAISSLIVFLLSLYYFFEQMNKPSDVFIYQKRYFWIVTAYFIYTAGTFFVFLVFSSSGEDYTNLLINSFFVIIKTIFLSIAMFMKNTPAKPKKFELY